MRNDHDGTRALRDLVARGSMHAHHVLAAFHGTEVLKDVIALVDHDQQHAGSQGQHQAHSPYGATGHTSQKHAQQQDDCQHVGHQLAQGMGVELLNRRLKAVVLHYLDQGFRRLELLLTVCGCNSYLVVEIVHVVARLCHLISFAWREVSAIYIRRSSIRLCASVFAVWPWWVRHRHMLFSMATPELSFGNRKY